MSQSDFEEWYKEKHGFNPVKGSFVNYLYAEQQSSWVAWQARQAEIDELKQKIADLEKQLEPDQFWLHDDPENSYAIELENLINEHADNCFNNPDEFVGEEFLVMQATKRPTITIKITGYTKDEDGEWGGWIWEEK